MSLVVVDPLPRVYGLSMTVWDDEKAAYAAAAQWFVATVPGASGRWGEHGLGEWDVRALVGHTTRSFLTVEEYVARRAASVEVATPVDYYLATSALAAGPGVADRGRAAGEALGADLVAAVAVLADRVLPLVDACDGSELVTTIVGGMRLVDYLPTRTFELVVHTLDLRAALGADGEPPLAASRAALRLAADVAAARGRSGAALLALTGRRPLPEGFSVL